VNIPVFKKKLLAVAIATAPIYGAQAAIIDLSLSAATSAKVGSDLAVTDSEGPSSGYVDSSAYDDNSSGVYEYASAYADGDTDGSFYSNASGSGTFESSATFLQSYSVENDPFDQTFDFTFTIENGSLEVGCNGYGGDGYGGDGYGSDCSGTSNASYDAKILLNGSAIWTNMAELAFDGTDISLTTSGDMLGTYTPSSSYYSWSHQSFTIDLGSFAANETFTLDYEITLNTYGNDGYSYAQFGDPNGFGQSGSPFIATVTNPNPTSVPEPTSLGILAAGLGLLGLNRRRKNKAHH
jgi:hypothetical protein